MGFLNFVSKVGQFAGGALRKVGEIGSHVISKIGSIGVPVYRAINNFSNGLIGDAIESIPKYGGLLKTVGKYLGDANFMNKAANVASRIGMAGGALEHVARGVGDND